MTAPLIGVTTSARFTPSWPFLALSVWRAGGRPKRITPKTERVDLDALDGVVIGGGDDIGADLYGGKAMVDTAIDLQRDEVELSLLERFWPTRKPILGICRGAQIMNVFRGGSLHSDIYEVYLKAPKMRTVLPKKRVSLARDAALRAVIGEKEVLVNSLHHQSVDRLGRGMRVSASDEQGMVQAIEETGDRFRFGVQWHPEFLIYKRPHRRLFDEFVAAA